MVLADWSKISGADLQLIRKACHLNYGAISTGSESRYIHNGTENHFYVSQGMSTWFALVKPSSGTAKMRIGGIFKYYDNNNYVYSYLEIEIDSNGNIVSAKVVYGKVDGGQVVIELEEDVTDKIQHLVGMAVEAIISTDDFEDGTLQGWHVSPGSNVSVVDVGYKGAKSLRVRAEAGAYSGSSSAWSGAYKDIVDVVGVKFLTKKSCSQSGYCASVTCSASVGGVTPPDNWGWVYVSHPNSRLRISSSISLTSQPGQFCSGTSDVYVDTVKYVSYPDVLWAFIKFYGHLKQIEGKWYLDIEVKVSDNYYESPDTSVEPSTTKISSYLMEIPSAIVGNNTKCGIILGREASNWVNQDCPNTVSYTHLTLPTN